MLAVLLSFPVLGGCGDDDDDEDQVEVPNPASVFCEEEGGTVEIETDADGNQTGICVLPSGERVDEWEYFREHGDG
jgi:putative hemolysin